MGILPALLLVLMLFVPGVTADANPLSPLRGKIVIVDPGHGGYDPGAVRGGVYEKNINLQIALKLKKSLEEKGAVVILTRNGDYNLAIPGLHKREAHRYDLNKRLEMANRSRAGLYISIHVNCICSRYHGGAEVFYYPFSEKSKLLAHCIQIELLSVPGIQKRSAKASDCYVLRNARIPAVLVEAGYLSNPNERNNLLSEEYQSLLSEKISCGIQRYLFLDHNFYPLSIRNL